MKQHKLVEWSNKLGYTMTTAIGEWDIWKPMDGRPWTALFFKTGYWLASRKGQGDTLVLAVQNATAINQH